jgi:exoribonuclease R
MKKPNVFEVFIKDLGFVNMELFNDKISYQFKFIQNEDNYIIKNEDIEYNYKIGQKIKVKILKKDSFLPHNSFKIIPEK